MLRREHDRGMLSPTPDGVSRQREYINSQVELAATKRLRYLLVTELGSGRLLGTVKWTELLDPSRMGWESLVMLPDSPPLCSLDVIVTTYRMCFESLGRPLLGPWRVSRKNDRMMAIHEHMGIAKIVGQDSANWWLAVTQRDYLSGAQKFTNMKLGEYEHGE